MNPIYYSWFQTALDDSFSQLAVLKESERGSVRLIQHRTTGQRFILRSFTGSAEVYRMLLNYKCPHLPTTYEVTSDGSKHLILEEYIQGDNMGVMLQGALFTSEETREIARQLCRALWVLHKLGAVHRDVKPENVILRGRDAVLIDFDAARIHKNDPEASSDTVILGTTGFAAPEQYGMSQSDARSDIYSLGILINVMLTGSHPSHKLADGQWGRIVTRCTQVNPAKRYQTVLRLLDEL